MANELARILGSNIRAYRKNLSLTQEALAGLVELSTPYVNLLEAGKKFPAEDTMIRLAKVLGVRPYELFVDPLVDSIRPDLVSSAVSEDFIEKLTAVVQRFAVNYRDANPKKAQH